MTDYTHLINRRCLTPWGPRRVIVVQEIEGHSVYRSLAFGYFEDNGQTACYPCHELEVIEAKEERDA